MLFFNFHENIRKTLSYLILLNKCNFHFHKIFQHRENFNQLHFHILFKDLYMIINLKLYLFQAIH